MALKSIGVAMAGVLTLGVGTPTLAQTAAGNTATVDTAATPVVDDDDGDEGKWGLLGLLGLAGLLGLKRRDNHVHVDRTTGNNNRL